MQSQWAADLRRPIKAVLHPGSVPADHALERAIARRAEYEGAPETDSESGDASVATRTCPVDDRTQLCVKAIAIKILESSPRGRRIVVGNDACAGPPEGIGHDDDRGVRDRGQPFHQVRCRAVNRWHDHESWDGLRVLRFEDMNGNSSPFDFDGIGCLDHAYYSSAGLPRGSDATGDGPGRRMPAP